MGKVFDKTLYINLALQNNTFILEPFFLNVFHSLCICVEFGVTVGQGNFLTLWAFLKHRLCFNWFYIYGIMKLIVF